MENDEYGFDNFKEEVKEKLAKEYPDARITENVVVKSNDNHKTAILINHPNQPFCPSIYIEDLYNNYIAKEIDIEGVLREIKRIYSEMTEYEGINNTTVEMIKNKEYILNNVCVKLINKNLNKEYLKNTLFTDDIENFATIYFLPVKLNNDENASVNITNELLDKAGITFEEIKEIAKDNTERLFPVSFNNLRKYIGNCLDIIEDVNEDVVDIYILSNRAKLHGATTILYPYTLQQVCKKIDCSKIIMIPSSVHEWLILPYESDTDICGLNEMIDSVNHNCVSPEEVLDDKAYIYELESNQMKCA